MGMLQKARCEVTHLPKACARKLALRDIFKVFQLWKEDKTKLMSAIQLEKIQEENKKGQIIANTTNKASPSKASNL